MYFTVVTRCWCMELECESWMKLIYRRESVPERELVRDFLISAEPIPAPIAESAAPAGAELPYQPWEFATA